MTLPSPPPGIVTFNFSDWIQLYPEFTSSVGPVQGQGYFNQALGYVDNSGAGALGADPFILTNLLYLMTAHWASLFALDSTGQPRQVVGHVDSVTQGSVTVAASLGAPLPSSKAFQAWCSQTPYGAAFYAQTSRIRTGRYFPARRPGLHLRGRGRFGF